MRPLTAFPNQVINNVAGTFSVRLPCDYLLHVSAPVNVYSWPLEGYVFDAFRVHEQSCARACTCRCPRITRCWLLGDAYAHLVVDVASASHVIEGALATTDPESTLDLCT
jgi:hypothetical protein